MSATLLADVQFHELLLAIDRDLADACRVGGCHCGGVLHSARYPRKPRGRPKAVARRLGREHDLRFSFCCAVDGCRSRDTPPSVRFLGRRVYVAAIVALIAIFRHGVDDERCRGSLRSCRSIGAPSCAGVAGGARRFTTTPFWRIARAQFAPPVDVAAMPAALFERFVGDDADRLVALLRPSDRRRWRSVTVGRGPQSMLVATTNTLCQRRLHPSSGVPA